MRKSSTFATLLVSVIVCLQTTVLAQTPEFINQPYYYNRNDNHLITLESETALMFTNKKTLGVKGAKQVFSIEDPSSNVKMIAKNNYMIEFTEVAGAGEYGLHE